MRFNEETLTKINEILVEKQNNDNMLKNEKTKIILKDSLNFSVIRDNGYCGWEICKFEDLPKIIRGLTMLKETVEEVSGVIL